MALVLGIDSSTQATKALLVDADSGAIIASGRSPHPPGTEVNPAAWLRAVDDATGELLPRADAVAVAGQQHGLVALGDDGRPVREALLWNDLRSSRQAKDLVVEVGGPDRMASRTGSVPVASFTSTKLRWMRDNEGDLAARVTTVVLPHDYVSHHLAAPGTPWFTDRGDASGTGYYSPADNDWDAALATLALGHDFRRPRILRPADIGGEGRVRGLISAGTGDNMAAALGLGLSEGEVSISVGTSGVAAMVSRTPTADPTGSVSGFADATGRFLPLACTVNAARVVDWGCRLLGVGHEEFASLALAAAPGAGGVVLLPYLDGERLPNRPWASGMFYGLRGDTGRAELARAVVEGLACSLADAVAALQSATDRPATRVLVTGGGARNPALQAILPAVLGNELTVPGAAEYVALGAARQAAWALAGKLTADPWPRQGDSVLRAQTPMPHLLDRYRAVRDATAGWERLAVGGA